MNKKIAYVCCIFFIQLLFVGCEETQIDNDIRVLVKGNVIDQTSSPVSNAHIEVYTDTNSSLSDRVLVGEGYSNAAGEFNVTSLFGPNDLFYILISADNQYSTYRYQTSTEEYTPNDLLFDLHTVELAQLAVFNYSITKESDDDMTLDYIFRFIEPYCFEIYEEDVINETASSCFEVKQFSGQLNNLNPNVEDGQILVPLQSQVEFIYSINEGEQTSQIIDVNTLEHAFQFNY